MLHRLYAPPSRPYLKEPKGHYNWERLGCRSYRKVVSLPPSGFYYGFSDCIYFHSLFHVLDMTTRQRRFKIKIFLPLDAVPSWAAKVHLLKTAGYEVCFSSSPILRLGAGLSCQGIFEIHVTEAFYSQWDMTTFGTYIMCVYKHLITLEF